MGANTIETATGWNISGGSVTGDVVAETISFTEADVLAGTGYPQYQLETGISTANPLVSLDVVLYINGAVENFNYFVISEVANTYKIGWELPLGVTVKGNLIIKYIQA